MPRLRSSAPSPRSNDAGVQAIRRDTINMVGSSINAEACDRMSARVDARGIAAPETSPPKPSPGVPAPFGRAAPTSRYRSPRDAATVCELAPSTLKAVRKSGRVGVHMSDIPEVSPFAALGTARTPVRRQSHQSGRHGRSAAGAGEGRRQARHDLSASASQSGAGRSSRRPLPRGRRSRAPSRALDRIS